MEVALNNHYKSRIELVRIVGLLGLCTCHSQDVLCKSVTLGLPNTDWADAGLFIQPNQMARHQCVVHIPWWAVVCEPLRYQDNNLPEVSTVLT